MHKKFEPLEKEKSGSDKRNSTNILDVTCPSCRVALRLYPKSPGPFSQGWIMNCTICSNKNIALDPNSEIHKEVIGQLNRLMDGHGYGVLEQNIDIVINTLAEQYDDYLYYCKCECGGQLSLAAKPKCPYCNVEVSSSLFHYADEDA